MCKAKFLTKAVFILCLFGPTLTLAAENGITKEDLKRLQINAFAEELQSEMEKTAHTDLASTMENTQVEIENNVASGVVEDKTMPAAPSVSSR